MSEATKVAARGAILSLPAALAVMYWASRLFPSIVAWLLGYGFFVLALAPIAAGSAYVVWKCSTRWPSRLSSLVVGTAFGMVTFFVEGLLLYFVHPSAFGEPFSASNLFPGLVTGALTGYARLGVSPATLV
jgi:hypothetical protein